MYLQISTAIFVTIKINTNHPPPSQYKTHHSVKNLHKSHHNRHINSIALPIIYTIQLKLDPVGNRIRHHMGR